MLLDELLERSANKLSVDEEVERPRSFQSQQVIDHLRQLHAPYMCWHSYRRVRDNILRHLRVELHSDLLRCPFVLHERTCE